MGNGFCTGCRKIEQAAEGSVRPIDPAPLYPIRQGLVLFLLPDRLVEFNAGGTGPARIQVLRRVEETRLERFRSIVQAWDGGLSIAGAHGLARIPGPLRNLTPETPWNEYLLPEGLPVRDLQVVHEQAGTEGGAQVHLTATARCSTNAQRWVLMFNGGQWKSLPNLEQRLRHAWRGPDRTYWAVSIDGLWRWAEGDSGPVEDHEVSARQYL